MNRIFLIVTVSLIVASPALADGRGEGGIVITEGAKVYKKSDSEKVEATLPAGVAVTGVIYNTSNAWFGSGAVMIYQFNEKDGRLGIMYYRGGSPPGMIRKGWMDPEDLERFLYDDCGSDGSAPYVSRGGVKTTWNVCFKEARDAKLEEMADSADLEE